MAVPIPNSVLPTSRQTYCCRVAITNIPAAGAHTPATIRPLRPIRSLSGPVTTCNFPQTAA